MREIKFRAWEKHQQRMSMVTEIKWNPSYLYHRIKTQAIVRGKKLDEWYAYDFDANNNGIVLMQYTGLKDKNGKEIYEGDVVKFADIGEEGYEYKEAYDFCNIASIVWKNGRFELENIHVYISYVLECMNREGHEEFINALLEDCEVIGNIYENKDLLEERNIE